MVHSVALLTDATLTPRQEKRLRTYISLREVASRLVEERGFDQVTVEDICAEVEVSPRTFFNYFASKEAAVLGPDPRPIDEACFAWFDGSHPEAPKDKPISYRVLAYMFYLISEELTGRMFSSVVMKRRRAIKESNPIMARKYFAKFYVMQQELSKKLTEFFQNNPSYRRLETDSAEQREAVLLSAAVFSALLNGYRQWQAEDIEHPERALDYCNRALEDISAIVAS